MRFEEPRTEFGVEVGLMPFDQFPLQISLLRRLGRERREHLGRKLTAIGFDELASSRGLQRIQCCREARSFSKSVKRASVPAGKSSSVRPFSGRLSGLSTAATR